MVFKIKKVKKFDTFLHVEVIERNSKVVEKFLDISEFEGLNSLTRTKPSIIEFPIFSKDPTTEKDSTYRYYFTKDMKSYLEIIPTVNEPIPGEFDERVFLAILKVMEEKGNKPIFVCTHIDILNAMNVSYDDLDNYYSKMKSSIIKLSKTIYSFNDLYHDYSIKGKFNGLTITPIITTRIITCKDATAEEKELLEYEKIKEIYKIRVADDIFNDLTNKGCLNFNADTLLNLGNSVVRSLYTQMTKWRNNSLYLKIPFVYIAKKIPLPLKETMVYSTVEKINQSLQELKDTNLILDFNYINVGEIEKHEFEIFFSEAHNEKGGQLFYKDKEEYSSIVYENSYKPHIEEGKIV